MDRPLGPPTGEQQDIFSPQRSPNAPAGPPVTQRQVLANMISQSSDPESERARVNASTSMARVLNVDPAFAYRNHDTLAEAYWGKPMTPMSNWEAIKNEWRIGETQAALGRLGRQLWFDPTNEDLLKQYDDLLAQMPAPDDLHRSLPVAALKAAAQMSPYSGQIAAAGVKHGLAAAGAGAMAAGIAGQMGPQVLLPEEVISVPATAIVAYTIASKAASVAEAITLTTGMIMGDLLQLEDANGNHMDPTLARAAAAGGGILSGLMETAQIHRVISGNSFLARKTSAAISGVLRKMHAEGTASRMVCQFAGEYFGNVATETIQEVAQESLEFAAKEIGVKLNNELQGTRMSQSDIDDYIDIVQATIRQSALGFSVIGLPGSVNAAFTNDQTTQRDSRERISQLATATPKAQNFVNQLTDEGFLDSATDEELDAVATAMEHALPVSPETVETTATDSGIDGVVRGQRAVAVDYDVDGDTVRINQVDVHNTGYEVPALVQVIKTLQDQNPDRKIAYDDTNEELHRAVLSLNPDVRKLYESIDTIRERDVTANQEAIDDIAVEIATLREAQESGDDDSDVDPTERIAELEEQRAKLEDDRYISEQRINRLNQAIEQYNADDYRKDWQLPRAQAVERELNDESLDNLDWSQTPQSNRFRAEMAQSSSLSAAEQETVMRLLELRTNRMGIDEETLFERFPLQIKQGETEAMLAAGQERGRQVPAATSFSDVARTTVWLAENATFRDVVHELSHYFTTTMSADERSIIEKHTGHLFDKKGNRNQDAWEKLAFQIERYTYDGFSENPEMDGIISQIASFIRKFYSSVRELVTLSADNRRAIESLFAPEQTTSLDPDNFQTRDLRVDEIYLSDDVPQFKQNADPTTGVVDQLGDKTYRRLATGPIVVWERSNGRMEVITGRHRLDLARNTGEKTIPSQIVREDDGFTRDMAMTLDAEANIRDGNGEVSDYASYFRHTEISEEEARVRGLLGRNKGRAGFEIGRYAENGLYTLYQNGEIGPQKTAAIAKAAPNDEASQAEGIRRRGAFKADELENYVRIISGIKSTDAGQTDLFGNDDAAMIQAEKFARDAAAHRSELRAEATALKQALKVTDAQKAKLLEQYGSADFDRDQIATRLRALANATARWDNWTTDAELVDWLRDPQGADPALVGDEFLSDVRLEVKNPDTPFSTPAVEQPDELFMTDAWNNPGGRTPGLPGYARSIPEETLSTPETLFSTLPSDAIRRAVERLDPVTNGTLDDYAGEPWADAEIEARTNFAEQREAFSNFWGIAKTAGSVDGFIRMMNEEYGQTNEEWLKDIYHDAHGEDINQGNRRWAEGLTTEEIAEVAKGSDAFPLKMIDRRIEKGNAPTEQMLKVARAYLKNNATEYRKSLGSPEERRRIQREQLRAIERGVEDTSTTKLKFQDVIGDLNRFRDDPAFRRMIAGSVTAADVTEITENLEKIIKSSESTAKQKATAQEKAKIAKQYKEYMRKLGSSVTKRVPSTVDAEYRHTIEELQRAVDPSFRTKKALERKNARREWLKRNPEAREALSKRTLKTIDAKSLNEMTQEELECVRDDIQRLITIGKNKKRIRGQLFMAKVKGHRGDILRALAGRDHIQKEKPWAETAGERRKERFASFKTSTLRPWAILDAIDGGGDYQGPTYELFFNETNRAVERELRSIERREERVHGALEGLGLTVNDFAKKRMYGTRELTMTEALAIYAAAKNASSHAYLNAMDIDDNEIAAVSAALTPEEVKAAEAIMDDYEQEKERLRQAHLVVANVLMDYEENYTPIVTVSREYSSHKDQLTEESLMRANLKRGKAPNGMTIGRMKNMKNRPAMKLDLYGVWAEEIRKSEHYIESAQTIKMQWATMNKQVKGEITSVMGRAYTKELEAMVNRFANPTAYNAYSPGREWVKLVRTNAAIAFLSYNMVTAWKQVFSVAYYLGDTSPGRLLSGIGQTMGHWKATRDFVFARDAQMKNRGIDRAYEELATLVRSGKIGAARGTLVKAGMAEIKFMDRFATLAGWKAVYDHSITQGLSEEEAIEAARNATLRTQPASRPKDTASILTDDSLLLFTQFSNQLNQMWNMVTYDIPAHMKNGHALDRAIPQITGLTLSAFVMWALANRRPPEDGEDYFNVFRDQFLAMVPIIGPAAAAALKGFSNEPTAFTPVSAAVKASNAMYSMATGDDVDWERLSWDVYEGVAVGAGLPYIGPKRAWNAYQDIKGGAPAFPSIAQHLFFGGKWYLTKDEQLREEPWRR